jgi:hypothetical protein
MRFLLGASLHSGTSIPHTSLPHLNLWHTLVFEYHFHCMFYGFGKACFTMLHFMHLLWETKFCFIFKPSVFNQFVSHFVSSWFDLDFNISLVVFQDVQLLLYSPDCFISTARSRWGYLDYQFNFFQRRIEPTTEPMDCQPGLQHSIF